MSISPPKYVRASGDDTGATDAAAIQEAIDSFDGSNSTFNCAPSVILSGIYYIDTPLVCGDVDDATVTPPQILAAGQAYIQYVGDDTNDYMLSIFGHVRGSGPCLSGVRFYPNRLARGVLIHNQRYKNEMCNVHVYLPQQVGIDLVDCWDFTMRNCYVHYSNGFACRTWRCNGLHAVDCKLMLMTASTPEWPATDETTIVDTSGSYVQTAEANRAAILISGDSQTWENIGSESSELGAIPLVNITGYSVKLLNWRTESIGCTGTIVRFVGGVSTGSYFAKSALVIDGGSWHNDDAADYFLTITDASKDVAIRNARVFRIDTAQVRLEAGEHTGLTLENNLMTTSASGNTTLQATETSIAAGASIARSMSMIGGPQADGAWRLNPGGDDLLIQRFESGSWVTKSTISAT